MSNTLVTGGLGFVGSKLVQRLITKDQKPTLLVREYEKEQCLSQFGDYVQVCTIDEVPEQMRFFEDLNVINLAGKYYFNPTQAESDDMIESNIVLPRRLARALSKGSTEIKWIQASTFMQHVDSSPFFPSCFYAATKYSAECEIATFAEHGISMTALVLPQIFGENDKRQKLLNYLVEQIKKQDGIMVSSGTQVMDLVHVDDVVDAIITCIRDNNNVGRYQISSNNPLTIKQLIALIFEASAKTVSVAYDGKKDRLYEPKEIWKCADPLKNWTPKKSIDIWLKHQFELKA